MHLVILDYIYAYNTHIFTDNPLVWRYCCYEFGSLEYFFTWFYILLQLIDVHPLRNNSQPNSRKTRCPLQAFEPDGILHHLHILPTAGTTALTDWQWQWQLIEFCICLLDFCMMLQTKFQRQSNDNLLLHSSTSPAILSWTLLNVFSPMQRHSQLSSRPSVCSRPPV